MRKQMFSFSAGAFCLVFIIGFSASALAQDDPNEFNRITGLSFVSAGTASGTCGWEIVAVRDGSAQQGSDGGQLTIKLNTCRIFQYWIERFPQNGGAGGTADLKADDLIIVWDEDTGHGSEESHRNFSYTGTYLKIDKSEYEDYLELSSTDPPTNWAVYRAETAGTFTKGHDGTNEHEILLLQHNMMSFTKDDDVEPEACVVPEQEITYTICWDNLNGRLLTDAYIIDWLPEGVSYEQGQWTIEFGDPNDPNQPGFTLIPPDPGYDPETHSYVWLLNDIDPNAWGCVQLTVVVNEKAVPGGILHNVAELWGTIWTHDPNDPNVLYPEHLLVARATVDTDVCCYEGTVEELFVDQSAVNGNKTGLNWQNAFLDLQDALDYARSSVCAQVHSIYVAASDVPYNPGQNTSDSFVLPDGISVYGGFPKGGGDLWQRNPKRYQTTLTGKINDTQRNETVVAMGNNTVLDGFTVMEADRLGQGIYGLEADFAISNCNIIANEGYGLYAEDCNVYLKWCNFRNNKADGIRHIGEEFALIIENCWVRQSGQYGVYCLNSTPIILNSVLSESDMSRDGRAGIMMVNPADRPFLQNVTCAHNNTEGIAFAGTKLPEIINSIVYHNGGVPLEGFSADDAAWYSCIEDADTVNYNINTDPQFAYFDPNNVRLSPNSLCRNASNPYLDYSEQLDMDSNPRVYGIAPDMGAYELTCDMNVSNEWDWNADGLVNLAEFARFSRVWRAHDPNDPALTDPNHVDYEYRNDPNSPGYASPSGIALWYPDGHTFNYVTTGASQYRIDLADLLYWLEEAPWLWKACWVTEDVQPLSGGQMLMMSGGESMLFSAMATSEPVVEEKSVRQQILDLAMTIVTLEQLWLEDPDIQQTISPENWQQFMEAIYGHLLELRSESIQIE